MADAAGLLDHLHHAGLLVLGRPTHVGPALGGSIHAIGTRTHLCQNREHGSHGRLVVVGAGRARREALHDVCDGHDHQGYARHQADDPQQHTHRNGQEPEHLDQRHQGSHQHAGERSLVQR